MRQLARKFWDDQKFRFLVVGGCNTASGYVVSAGAYYLLAPRVHYLWILTLATIINVTLSYLGQKVFVFKTKGNHLREYVRFYLVNAMPIALGYLLFPPLVKGLHVNPYVALALILGLSIMISYLGHSRISFRPSRRVVFGRAGVAAAAEGPQAPA